MLRATPPHAKSNGLRDGVTVGSAKRIRLLHGSKMPLANDNKSAGRRRLLFVPGEPLGHDLHLAPSVLRMHENHQASVSSFPLEY